MVSFGDEVDDDTNQDATPLRLMSLMTRQGASPDDADEAYDAIRDWVRASHGYNSWEEFDLNLSTALTKLPNDVCLGEFDLVNHLDVLSKLVVKEIRTGTAESSATGQLLVQKLATIPGFILTVVLLKKLERDPILQHPLMKRVVLRPMSITAMWTEMVNSEEAYSERLMEMLPRSSRSMTAAVKLESWVMALIDSNDLDLQKRAVDYFEHISEISLDDYRQILTAFPDDNHRSAKVLLRRGVSVAAFYAALPATATEEELLQEYRKIRRDLFDIVGRFRFLTTMLLSLPENETDRVVLTPIVRYALSRATKRPFVAVMNFCDFFLHFVLVLVWRRWILLDVERTKELNWEVDGKGLWTDIGVYLVATAVSYFVFRLLGNLIALARVSPRLGLKFCYSPNVLILVGMIVAMFISTLGASQKSNAYVVSTAVSILFLWTKLIIFLQTVNKKFAAYILATVQILKELFWFLVLLFIFGIGLGDTMTQLYATNPKACPFYKVFSNGTLEFLVQDITILDSKFAEIGFLLNTTTGLLYPRELFELSGFVQLPNRTNTNPFCDGRRQDGYFAIYRLFLKNFTFSEFRLNVLTTFLFVLSTFMIIVILLNLLIAIINMNYEDSFNKATALFGRARLTFVAQLTAMEDLLHPRYELPNKGSISSAEDKLDWFLHFLLRLLATASLVLTAMSWIGGMWFVGDFVNNWIVGLVLAVVGVVPIVLLGIYLFIGWDSEQRFLPLSNSMRFVLNNPLMGVTMNAPLELFSRWTLGVSDDDANIKESRVSEMQFRVRLLESRLQNLQEKLEDNIEDQVGEFERRIAPILKKLQ